MKAITVRQPWASLIVAGVKTIETRPRPTSYRGRIAIHAGKHRPTGAECQDVGDWQTQPDGADGFSMRHVPTAARAGRGQNLLATLYPAEIGKDYGYRPLPLGAVVGSANLTDCVPIIEDDTGPRCVEPHFSVSPNAYGYLYPAVMPELGWYAPEDEPRDMGDQFDFGDFSPGRWALILDDPQPTTARCPWCWGYTVWPDVCDVCGRDRMCDPVPARGRQAVPWEWAP